MHQGVRLLACTGHQHSVRLGCEALGDNGNLLWGLAKAKDHLREPPPQGSMVVQFCEAQILVWEVVQLDKSRRNRHIADL